jgi:hypothetical protein
VRHDRAFQSPSVASLVALVAAYALCTAVIVFSWPDPYDRKRATEPGLVGCCGAKVADTVLVARRTPPSRVLVSEAAGKAEEQAKIVPASLR